MNLIWKQFGIVACLINLLGLAYLQGTKENDLNSQDTDASDSGSGWIQKRFCSQYDASYVQHFFDRVTDNHKAGYLVLLTTQACGKCEYLTTKLEEALLELDKTPNISPPKCLLYNVANRNEVFPRLLRITQLPTLLRVTGKQFCQASNRVNFTKENLIELATDPISLQDETLHCGKLPDRLPNALDNLLEWYTAMMGEFSQMVTDIFNATVVGGYVLVTAVGILGFALLYALVQLKALFADEDDDDGKFKIKVQPVPPKTPGSVTPARKGSEAEPAQNPPPANTSPETTQTPSKQQSTASQAELLKIKKNK